MKHSRIGDWARAVTAVGLAATLLPLAGCGGSSEAAKVVVWHGYTDVQAKQLNALAGEWNADNPNDRVKLVFNGGNDGALQKTLAGFTAGNFPDVAYEYGSSAAQLARQPGLVDLTDRVGAAGFDWNDFFPAERQACTVNGKVIGVPALVDNLALVYNKKLFTAAGIPQPTDSWSWVDFRAAAKRLTDRATQRYGWAYVNDGSEDTVWRYLTMLWQAGGDLMTPDGTRIAFNSPAGLTAMRQLRDMAVTDGSVYLDNGHQNYQNLFNSGKIAMLWTGPWDLSAINSDVDYGVTFLPGLNGNHQTIAGPDVYMVFKHSVGRVDAAWRFVTWLLSPEVHLRYAIATGDLPVRVSETALPDYQKYLAAHPGTKTFTENLNNVRKVRPNVPAYPKISAALGQAVERVMLGQATPEKALFDAAKQADSALATQQ